MKWRSLVYWLASMSGAVALLVVGVLAAPRMGFSPVFAYVIGFSAVAGESLIVALFTPRFAPPASFWLVVPIAMVLAVRYGGASGTVAAALITVSLLAGGTLLGSVVGSAIEHPGHLVFVAIVSAGADVFSLFTPVGVGVTATIVESPKILSIVTLPWPMLGTDQLASFLGVGEVVFAGLYIAASRAHGLDLKRTVLALAGAFACTMVAVMVSRQAIPALPFFGAAILLLHPRARRPTARDARLGWIGMGLLAAAFGGWFLLSRL